MIHKPADVAAFYNRRAVNFAEVPAPDQVSEEAIELCRDLVEPDWKYVARALLLPWIRRRSKAWEIGEGFQWGKGMSIQGARIGRYVYVGPGSSLAGPVSIGDLTMISSNVTLVGNDHDHRCDSVPMRARFTSEPRPVTVIMADCLIGYGAILMEGVTLARGTVVGAGAVVTRDTTPYSVMGGSPARFKQFRFKRALDKWAYEKTVYGQSDS